MAARAGAWMTGRRCGQQHGAAADGNRRRAARQPRQRSLEGPLSPTWAEPPAPSRRSRWPPQRRRQPRPPARPRHRLTPHGQNRNTLLNTTSPVTARPETPPPTPPAQKHLPRHRLPRHRPPRKTALGTASPARPVPAAAGGPPITPRQLRVVRVRRGGRCSVRPRREARPGAGNGGVLLREGPSRPSCTGSRVAASSARRSVNRVVRKYQKSR